jgi:hypothetical protein
MILTEIQGDVKREGRIQGHGFDRGPGRIWEGGIRFLLCEVRTVVLGEYNFSEQTPFEHIVFDV